MKAKDFFKTYTFPIIFTLLGIPTAIYLFINDVETDGTRGFTALLLVLIGWLPLLLGLLKANIPFSLQTTAFIFIFFALYLGSCLNLYSRVSWYDILTHSIFGYVGALIAAFLLYHSGIRNHHVLFLIIVVLVSVGFGGIWEIYEFACDNLLPGYDAQRAATGVRDTMEDLICNLGGALAFVIHYVIDLFFFKKRFITAIESDFSSKGNDR